MRWLCVLTLVSGRRPGTLERLVRVFAERGISLDQVAAADRHGRPHVVLAFEAHERLRDHLVRRLARSPEVQSVQVEAAAGRSAWDLAREDTGPKPQSGW